MKKNRPEEKIIRGNVSSLVKKVCCYAYNKVLRDIFYSKSNFPANFFHSISVIKIIKQALILFTEKVNFGASIHQTMLFYFAHDLKSDRAAYPKLIFTYP